MSRPHPEVPIRPAQIDDTDQILQCLNSRVHARLSEKVLRDILLEARTLALVAVDGASSFVGCALGWSAGPVGELTEMAVLETSERRGHGHALLSGFLQGMKARAVDEVQLEVRRDNRGAIALYHVHQFRLVGTRTAYYKDGCDALLYSRFL